MLISTGLYKAGRIKSFPEKRLAVSWNCRCLGDRVKSWISSCVFTRAAVIHPIVFKMRQGMTEVWRRRFKMTKAVYCITCQQRLCVNQTTYFCFQRQERFQKLFCWYLRDRTALFWRKCVRRLINWVTVNIVNKETNTSFACQIKSALDSISK